MADDSNNIYKVGIPYTLLEKQSAEEIIYNLECYGNEFINSQHFQFFLRTAEFCKFVKIANFLDGVENARKAVSRS